MPLRKQKTIQALLHDTMMQIKNDWPPNIETIRAALKIPSERVVFTYGDTIYNPGGHEIDPALMAHEETHGHQQAEIGVEAWWERYLAEPEFRAKQEIAAYRRQFRALKKLTKDRNAVARCVHDWANSLAGDMYGGCVSYAEARHKITAGIS